MGGRCAAGPRLAAEPHALPQVEEPAAAALVFRPTGAVLLAAEEDGRRAEAAPEIAVAVSEPQTLRAASIGLAIPKGQGDHLRASSAGRLDASVGLERRCDSQGVVCAPSPEGGLPKRQDVRTR